MPDIGTNNQNEPLIQRNPNTIFLSAMTESEVLTTVNKFKNKTSTDFYDLNMILVKKVIISVLKPLTYICNMSFQTGAFPNKLKIAKVKPLCKNGNKLIFTNYRPLSAPTI